MPTDNGQVLDNKWMARRAYRLDTAGRKKYEDSGNSSMNRPPEELLGEMECEIPDGANWGEIFLAKLDATGKMDDETFARIRQAQFFLRQAWAIVLGLQEKFNKK